MSGHSDPAPTRLPLVLYSRSTDIGSIVVGTKNLCLSFFGAEGQVSAEADQLLNVRFG